MGLGKKGGKGGGGREEEEREEGKEGEKKGGGGKLYPISCYGGLKNGPPKTQKNSEAGSSPAVESSWNREAAP